MFFAMIVLPIYVVGTVIALMALTINEDRESNDEDIFRLLGWPLWLVCVMPIYIGKGIMKISKKVWNIKWPKGLCVTLMHDIRKAMES